jgi:hypothetical protein
MPQGDGDPCPPCPEHRQQKFVDERNKVAIDTIPRHEEPTRQPLLNRMPSFARHSWDIWIRKGLTVAKQNRGKG